MQQLHNPVPVRALFERDLTHEVTLRNLLQRKGYESLEAIWDKGKAEGITEGKIEGLQQAVFDICELLDIRLGVRRLAQVRKMDEGELTALRQHLKQHHAWPR